MELLVQFEEEIWDLLWSLLVALVMVGVMIAAILLRGGHSSSANANSTNSIPSDQKVAPKVWAALLLPNAVMHGCGGILLVVSPQFVIADGHGGAAGAGAIVGCFGAGLLTANLLGFKICQMFSPRSMCFIASIVGLIGVVLGGLLPMTTAVPVYGLAGTACLVGFAQSLHVVARTVYQAEAVKTGQAFVSGWVSASNVVGVGTAALISSFVNATKYITLAALCGSGLLLYCFLALMLMGSVGDYDAKTTGKASAEKVSRGTMWCSAHFFKVCFLIFATGLAREAQKFLIPLVAAEQGISATIVGHVAFVSQMESMVAAPVGGFLMEALGVVPVVFISLLLSAIGIQCLCVNGLAFYVHGASLLGLGCGLSAGSAIALSILHAPEGVEGQRRAFMNGCRFCNSLADLLLPVAFGSLSSAFSVLVAGSSLTVSTLVAVCIGLFLFPLKLMSEGFASTKVPSMDFVVPLKAVGAFTRTVLEGINQHYAPRKIHIICMEDTRETMKQVMADWSLPSGKINFVDEESYFQTMGFTREELKMSWSNTGPRDFGWWWQQLLKFGAHECIEDISENFCVWDADLVVLEPWPLLKKGWHGVQGCVAPLQEKFLSKGHQEAYESSTRHILGMEPTMPGSVGTWIAHHMVFNRRVLAEMLQHIEQRLESNGVEVAWRRRWPAKLLETSQQFERLSEYVIYGTYASQVPGALVAHHFDVFGRRGLRLYGAKEAEAKGRDSNEELIKELNQDGQPSTGYSYEKVATQVQPLKLTHLQMEHVLALEMKATP